MSEAQSESRQLSTREWLKNLEEVFGQASQAAFGSAVFSSSADSSPDLEKFALAKYREFCGDCWTRFGEENWMGNWKRLMSRDTQATPDVLGELQTVTQSGDAVQGTAIWEGHSDPNRAQAALQAAFDKPNPVQFQIFRIGDGEAMSGVLLAAEYGDQLQVALTFLMD